MYISEEQRELAKKDADFKRSVKEATNHAKECAQKFKDEFTEYYKLIYGEEIARIKEPTFKSKRVKVEKNKLLRSSASYEEVYIPLGVTEICESAFKNHKNAKIIFPENLKKIGNNAFEDCYNIYEFDVKEADLCYPPIFFVFASGEEAHQISRGFSQFPNTLEEIGDYAFRHYGRESYAYTDRKDLHFIIFPKSLQHIGKGAFMDSDARAVYMGGPAEISKACFSNCRRLQKLILGGKVKTIGELAFDSCNSLNKVVFSNTLKEIGNLAFAGCISLKKLDLPETLESIGNYAFCECMGIKRVAIPNNVTKIGERAFSQCNSLREVKLGTGINTIPQRCFSDCIKLTKIEIPNNVTIIADDAFKNCKKVVIYAHKGSYAEQYAKENNINFEEI